MTRTVTGTIRTPTGEPWPDFRVTFRVLPATFTTAATYPLASEQVATDTDGTFEVQLETGIQYEIQLGSGIRLAHRSAGPTDMTVFRVVVPEGEGPISLEAVRALGTPIPPPDPTILDAVIAAVEARLIPAGGLPGQALVKSAEGDYALTWGTADAHYSED